MAKSLERRCKESKTGRLEPVDLESSFTFKGYNDKPQPCLKDGCDGLVRPTYNAKVGKCDSCKERYNWAHYWRQYKSSHN